MGNITLSYPVECPVTQAFGENPGLYARFGVQGHNGVDFGCAEGTPVSAAATGTVTKIQTDPDGYGLHVRLSHSWGRTIYAHLSEVLCRMGQRVAEGETLARTGNSGFSSGPHLHFEARLQGQEGNGYDGAVDPLPLLVSSHSHVNNLVSTTPTPEQVPVISDELLGDVIDLSSGLLAKTLYEVISSDGLNVRIKPDKESEQLFGLVAGRQVMSITEQTDAQGNRWIGFVVWCSVKHCGVELMKEVNDND